MQVVPPEAIWRSYVVQAQRGHFEKKFTATLNLNRSTHQVRVNSYAIVLTKGSDELHDADDDGGQVVADDVGTHFSEDGNSVEDDCVDAAPLLEEHEAHREEEGQKGRTTKQWCK